MVGVGVGWGGDGGLGGGRYGDGRLSGDRYGNGGWAAADIEDRAGCGPGSRKLSEVFLELANYGEIEDVVVVDNLCDHLIGNVYVTWGRASLLFD